MIGESRYITDAKTKKVFKATVIGTNISESGYEIVRLLKKDNTLITTEKAHVHETEKQAQEFIAEKTPLIDGANQIIKEATEKVDKIRIQVIGEPKFKDLAEKIKK
jgi:hypothetical protein